MQKRVIVLCYRKVIDNRSVKQWDKLVFDSTYLEFKMQAQNFSQGTAYTSYAELMRNVANARRLTGMVTPSATGYIQQLGSIMPDILNNVGRRFLTFSRFQFEIINSDINDKDKHQVAVNFYSAPLIWHDTIDSYLLISDHLPENQPSAEGDAISTNLMQLQPYVNISSLQYLD
ncbi:MULTISPECIES: hypothetical protein [Mucilaginibacter]|uniref:Uncharacterized protein n=1 Tax=Mucilaginibacter rubeus TaxID=2027860 RepID=A0A5C1HZT5_9SPHI|nr:MULTISPECIES: hypothetical protein [Mucilaginibacter]QEM11276.1 hypothetical protein DEO27_015000 [Mucilaginibacter rubeus]